MKKLKLFITLIGLTLSSSMLYELQDISRCSDSSVLLGFFDVLSPDSKVSRVITARVMQPQIKTIYL
jgi:hypothetical protein